MRARSVALRALPFLLLSLSLLSFAEPQARIVDPRYSLPVALLAGGSFNVTVAGAEAVGNAWVVAPNFNTSLRLEGSWKAAGRVTVKLAIPAVSPGLYDLCVNASGRVVCEPRSVWVLERWPEKLTIAHLTDLHVEIIVEGVRSTVFLETVIHLVNVLPVDLAVVTGDCVDVGADVEALKKLQKHMNSARKPTFLIPGNHDHAQTDARSFEELYYGRHVGPAHWYRVVGPFLIVGLDTGFDCYLGPLQLKWLESVLSRHKDRVKVLLMHHPFFRTKLFREVNGSWREIDKLRDHLYYKWVGRLDEARELLRLIEEYGVAAMLTGHSHADGLVVYNGKTWFITTTATCGGVRPGDYRGFKIVEVKSDGRVRVIGLPGRDPLRETSSFVLDGTVIRVLQSPDLRASTAVIQLSPHLGLDLPELTIYFPLNSSEPTAAYRIYGNVSLAKGLELVRYRGLYLAKLTVTAPGWPAFVTVAAYEDGESPQVSLLMYTPRRPVAGADRVLLYIKASDAGWGIRRVWVEYSTNVTRGFVIAREVTPGSYQAELPAINATLVQLVVKAIDFAGNVASESGKVEYVRPTPPPAPPPAAPPPRPQPTPQPQLPLVEIAVAVAVAVAAAVVVVILYRRR